LYKSPKVEVTNFDFGLCNLEIMTDRFEGSVNRVVRRIGSRSLLSIGCWVLVSGYCLSGAHNEAYEKDPEDEKLHINGLVVGTLRKLYNGFGGFCRFEKIIIKIALFISYFFYL
jgi:hypothetical protein